eukprot:TRINITY_DN1756_c0_g4_i1.p1 TRINITY_DN1756_c0_g4~~TRINITY_DN1756_c0_g4_i1.p1  ORF type:complete len:238 (-),score=16.54 TRINITY_DN1756_c0_g4_i1:491-1204(-)
MSTESLMKKPIFIIEKPKRFFWYEVACGIDRDYIEIQNDMLVMDIKAKIYEKLPELLKKKYGATDKKLLVLEHKGIMLTDGAIILSENTSAFYSDTEPAIVSWPGSENLVQLIKAFERLEKPLLSQPPFYIKKYYTSTTLSDRLLGMIDKGKYMPYFSVVEIAKNAEILKAEMKKEPLVISSEAGVVMALYAFLKHALLNTSYNTMHLGHVKMDPEYVIEQEFYDKKNTLRGRYCDL